jgi:hypothetical protein
LAFPLFADRVSQFSFTPQVGLQNFATTIGDPSPNLIDQIVQSVLVKVGMSDED